MSAFNTDFCDLIDQSFSGVEWAELVSTLEQTTYDLQGDDAATQPPITVPSSSTPDLVSAQDEQISPQDPFGDREFADFDPINTAEKLFGQETSTPPTSAPAYFSPVLNNAGFEQFSLLDVLEDGEFADFDPIAVAKDLFDQKFTQPPTSTPPYTLPVLDNAGFDKFSQPDEFGDREFADFEPVAVAHELFGQETSTPPASAPVYFSPALNNAGFEQLDEFGDRGFTDFEPIELPEELLDPDITPPATKASPDSAPAPDNADPVAIKEELFDQKVTLTPTSTPPYTSPVPDNAGFDQFRLLEEFGDRQFADFDPDAIIEKLFDQKVTQPPPSTSPYTSPVPDNAGFDKFSQPDEFGDREFVGSKHPDPAEKLSDHQDPSVHHFSEYQTLKMEDLMDDGDIQAKSPIQEQYLPNQGPVNYAPAAPSAAIQPPLQHQYLPYQWSMNYAPAAPSAVIQPHLQQQHLPNQWPGNYAPAAPSVVTQPCQQQQHLPNQWPVNSAPTAPSAVFQPPPQQFYQPGVTVYQNYLGALRPVGMLMSNGSTVYFNPPVANCAPPASAAPPTSAATPATPNNRKRKSRYDEEPRVKKPPNAFMLFLKEQRPLVAHDIAQRGTTAVTQYLAGVWRSMTEQQQAKYFLQAKEESRRHYQLHPDWTPVNSLENQMKRRRNQEQTTVPQNLNLQQPNSSTSGLPQSGIGS